MKMDVEGYKKQAFVGALDLPRTPELKCIIIETPSRDVLDLLKGGNLRRSAYDPFMRGLTPMGDATVSANSLMLRESVFVARMVREAAPFEIMGEGVKS